MPFSTDSSSKGTEIANFYIHIIIYYNEKIYEAFINYFYIYQFIC